MIKIMLGSRTVSIPKLSPVNGKLVRHFFGFSSVSWLHHFHSIWKGANLIMNHDFQLKTISLGYCACMLINKNWLGEVKLHVMA